LPNVRQFLKAGEAEHYQNMEVEFIPKRTPILTIYDDADNEVESINLADYDNAVEDLHQLVQSKGFVKKTKEEVDQIKLTKGAEYDQFMERRRNMEKDREELRRQRERARSEF